MIFVVLTALGLILGCVHIAATKGPRVRPQIADILLLYLFIFPIGLGGLIGFLGHTFRAGSTAASIGWPAHNPFQYEVAVANLAFGILGICCAWVRGGFRMATAIGWSVFILGAACVHLHQIHAGQPFAPGNAGAMLYFDLIVPALVLALTAVREFWA
ncbi:MAG TPA: DUF6790 family protein [Candidatus Acidoferrales bacterium]|nr:DUF6790 family protein [Candidatus Acidoferrales bacterium]